MLKQEIIDWVKEYATKNNFKLVVGISGGIDSAVVSTICCMTGLETHVVTIPIQQNKEQLNLARNHMEWLENNFTNVKTYEFDLTNTFLSFKYNLSQLDNNLGWANSKSRLRMVTLYQLATYVSGIVVGTGNKVEDFGVGFFTKYGDGGVDISPIADLTKTDVRNLAKELKIIDGIITAKPTDGLWEDDRTDEQQIGATYEELEWAMSIKENNTTKEFTEKELQILNIYDKYNNNNKHKMVPIPIFKKNEIRTT
jgi:NAD+ synthase